MFTRNLLKTASNNIFKRRTVWQNLAFSRSFSSVSGQTARRPHHEHGNSNSTFKFYELNEFRNLFRIIENQLKVFKYFILISPFNLIQQGIDLILRYNNVSLEIQFEKEKKIFFINEDFTFTVMKQMIEYEYPSSNVEFDFSRSGSSLINENSNLFNFLRSNEKGEVIVEIDDQQYVLRNSGYSTINQILEQAQKDSQDSQGALHWFLQCQKNKVHASHAGVLSHLISQFQQEIKNLKAASKKDNISLSETELDNIFIKTFKSFSTPVTQEIEQIQHEKNIVDQELSKLYEKRDRLYEAASKRSHFYLKLILFISLGHIAAFYYMIFHVDWLGWDIIEPITYTIAQLTVLLGIRFFWKHRQVRTFENIIDISKQKYLQQRVIKDYYANLREQISLKEQERSFLEKKQKILLNKKTYNTIILHDI